jgi:hypothetical protein
MTTAKAISADKLADLMEAQGYSPEEIQATTGVYAKKKYEPERVRIATTFELPSDVSVKIKETDHTLRYMNGADILRAVPVLADAIITLIQDQEMFAQASQQFGVEAVIASQTPVGWANHLINVINSFRSADDEYPVWLAAVLHEIGKLASTEALTITAGDFLSLRSHQQTELMIKLVEVNKRDFLEVGRQVWGALPPNIRGIIASKIFTPIWRVLNRLNQIAENSPSPSAPPSDGGPSSGGKPSSSSRSAPKPGSKTTKSSAAA